MLRNPDTANSRPIISTTIQAGTNRICTSETRAAEISNLSAIGSSSVPTVVIWPQRRARYPSNRSVAAAVRKIASATSSLGTQTTPCHSRRSSCSTNDATRNGTKKMRRMVSVFGTFMPRLTTRISLDDESGETALNGFGRFGLDFADIVLISALQNFGALMQQINNGAVA